MYHEWVLQVMGQCSNGDAPMLHFHRQEVFRLLLTDPLHLLLLRMQHEVLLYPQYHGMVMIQKYLNMTGLPHKIGIDGDELVQVTLQVLFFPLVHQVRCSDHVQMDTMCQQEKKCGNY